MKYAPGHGPSISLGEALVERHLRGALPPARTTLTPREEQVLALLYGPLPNKAIGQELGITEGTVKVYISRMLPKLGVSSRHDLMVADRRKLLAVIEGLRVEAHGVTGAD